jgi:23S rRNA (adenine2030-N6)-methyltransferase
VVPIRGALVLARVLGDVEAFSRAMQRLGSGWKDDVNYRHAFHAGNFADVMKHAILVRILLYLHRKATPIRVIDTHAGTGLYDLASDEALRTGEWQDGIGRLEQPFDAEVEAILQPYRQVIAEVRARYGQHRYPGSPLIIRELLRRPDRAVLVELHPADQTTLAELFKAAAGVKVLHLDGWTALHALVPPKERRGFVLIDPPYEKPAELERLGDELVRAVRKWPTGIYAGWYPIKDLAVPDAVAGMLDAQCPRPVLRLELLVERPDDVMRLNGCGLFVINPPWTLAEEAGILLPALADRLSRAGYGGYRAEALGPSL